MKATIRGIGHAVPAVMDQAGLWRDFFATHYAGSRVAERLWHAAGVTTRHGVVDPRVEDVSAWGTGARMDRFLTEALPLGKETIDAALADAGLAAADVDLFAVVTCTGYSTPGLDILLARDLGMRPDVQRLFVGHMGCYAAMPALASVSDAVRARGLTALMLSLELPSLHVQPPTTDVQQIVAHSLFSDAAVAVVVAPGSDGLEVVDVTARTDVATADHMTWDVTDLGFRMGLSPRVPDVLGVHVRDVVDDLLSRHALDIAGVAGWAIHPGGPRIVEVCADRLGLEPADVAASYDVLRDHGNCSSATVLLVLERLLAQRSFDPGDAVVAMAFGPGLTLYSALMRQV